MIRRVFRVRSSITCAGSAAAIGSFTAPWSAWTKHSSSRLSIGGCLVIVAGSSFGLLRQQLIEDETAKHDVGHHAQNFESLDRNWRT